MEKTVEAAVIGAGLTGLTTAFYLNRNKKDFIVLEEKDKPGGVIRTGHENGFVYEEGPNTGVIGNPDVVELFEDLDGLCRLENVSDKAKKRYILKNGKWEAMPMGLWDAINTPLFTFRDKVRILGEPFRAPGKDPDEPLSAMVKRRMGQSFLDYAIDPFILGVYSGDPSKLITKYAFPKLYNLEQNYGSFIGGSVKKSFIKKDDREKKATRKVFSVYGGLSNLVDALYESSGKERFLFNVKNTEIRAGAGHFVLTGTQNNEKFRIVAKKVITTTGSHALRPLLPFAENELLQDIEKLKYARVIQVVLGFNKWNGIPLDGFGGLIPFREKRDILGVLFLSTLMSDRAPADGALCSVFVGGIRRDELVDKSDDEVEEIVTREFSDLMGLKTFNPALLKINRYKFAIPQYGIESSRKLMAIEKIETIYKGLILGGNIRDGIGMADRIKQGKLLANNI
jgi:oxygen-dependent protoporphyrinogen oxidase